MTRYMANKVNKISKARENNEKNRPLIAQNSSIVIYVFYLLF